MRQLFALLAGMCLSAAATAATVTITWTNPTTNTTATGGATIPDTGDGSLASWRFEYGTCSAPNVFGLKAGEIARPRASGGPVLTTTTVNLNPGTTCVRGYVANTYGVESATSNVVTRVVDPPQPGPIQLTSSAPTAYDVVPDYRQFVFTRGRAVGTIKLGAACDEDRTVGQNYYALERPSRVQLKTVPRSTALVAKCAAG